MRRLFKMFVFLALMIALTSLTPVSAATIKIKPATVNMLKGEKKKLTINTKKKVKWASKNKRVATVSKKGVVTAKKKGTTTIYATVNGKKYTRKVSVYNVGEILTKSYKTVGNDRVEITSADGSSEYNLVVPYRLAIPDKEHRQWFMPAQVGLHIRTTDDKGYSNPTYWIYVDRILVSKMSIPFGYDGTIRGSERTSTKGVHTVEIIRYKDGLPQNEPVLYIKLKYKIIPM